VACFAGRGRGELEDLLCNIENVQLLRRTEYPNVGLIRSQPSELELNQMWTGVAATAFQFPVFGVCSGARCPEDSSIHSETDG